MSRETISILHLSDIHFRKKEKEGFRYFHNDVIEKMLAAIGAHVKKHGIPDFAAVTGDIAFDGRDYKKAVEFFDELKKIIPGAVFLPVPGNHDVDREEVDDLFSLHDIVKEGKVDKILENKKRIKTYITPKFRKFRAFVETHLNPGLYDKKKENKDDYFWVKDFPAKEVSFLGLNSCWACENDQDDRNIALGPPQVKEALSRTEIPHKILLMHHPFDWLNRRDKNKCRGEILAACNLVLHGHSHMDDALVSRDPDDSCICLGANASYTDEEGGFIGFQFIRVESREKSTKVTVWPYCLDKRNKVRFAADTRRWENQAGKEFFVLQIDAPQEGEEVVTPVEIPGDYCDWVRAFHSTMDIDQLRKKGEVITISLPEVYIPLETANPYHKIELEKMRREQGEKASAADMEEKLREHKFKEPPLIDIEKLLGKKNNILLRGDAGMGKTTLIKHLAYTISAGTGAAGLDDYLPVMVFFKDLWRAYREELEKEKGKQPLFEQLLKVYLEQRPCPLTFETVENFLSRGKVLFLFDGLDEMPEYLRPDLIDIIAGFLFARRQNLFLITGRPHGIAGRAFERFGKYLFDIEYLDAGKVENFISRWFRAVSGQATGLAEVTAEDLISDIRHNEHIAVFTRNPLLLTAVCILYHDGKRIPEQRAELYDRIVGNLIWRRFHDPAQPDKESQVLEYLMLLAFEMQKRGLKAIEKYRARELLEKVFPPADGEEAPAFRRRIDSFFAEIEPRCGLFNVLSSDDIEFTHLTFQEFLVARHMVYMGVDYKKYLKTGWWQETLLLYTGFVGIHNKRDSNNIVKYILKAEVEDDKNRDRIRLLGAKALRDFQESKREAETVALAREKLYKIIKSEAVLDVRFQAGEILGSLGDPRLRPDNMVEVPAGEFIRGSDKDYEWEKPGRKIYLDDFKIGKYPVTNREYKEFIVDGGYKNEEFWTPRGWEWVKEEKILEPEYWHDRRWNGVNFPVVGVSWYEANAYAQWLSRKTGKKYRLPSEAEWEKAARGPWGLVYPWGNDFDKNRCNSDECGLGRTNPVGIFPGGGSPYGCVDMAGNVWEWCADWYKNDYYKDSPGENPTGPDSGSDRVLRGGSWIYYADNCRASYRLDGAPGDRGNDLGFRLSVSF